MTQFKLIHCPTLLFSQNPIRASSLFSNHPIPCGSLSLSEQSAGNGMLCATVCVRASEGSFHLCGLLGPPLPVACTALGEARQANPARLFWDKLPASLGVRICALPREGPSGQWSTRCGDGKRFRCCPAVINASLKRCTPC